MKGLPPINYADAAALVEQLKLIGSHWFQADFSDVYVVDGGQAETVAAALLCMAQYAGQLEERMMELVESNTALAGQLESLVKHPAMQVQPWQAELIQKVLDSKDHVELIKPRQHGHGRVTGVEWRGSSAGYFDNMEAINRVLAQEITKLVSETPEARAGVMDGLSIDPSEVIEATASEPLDDPDSHSP